MILCLIVLASFLASNALATTEIIRDPQSWNFAPLQYSHLIVRGVVTSVSDTTVSGEDFWMEPRGQLPPRRTKLLIVRLKVDEVVRGPRVPKTWSHLYWSESPRRDVARFPIGSEMLICAALHPRLGVYYYSGEYGQYIRNGTGWQSGPTSRGERTFSDEALRAKINEMEPDRVAAAAELVIIGTVASIRKSDMTGPDSSWAEQVTLSMRVEKIEKGRFDDPMIDIVMLTRGFYMPAWRKHVPTEYAVGQRWLCFVKRNEVGWYPFAGSNGLLRMEERQLVYDDTVPFWHDMSEVDQVIRSVGGGVQH